MRCLIGEAERASPAAYKGLGEDPQVRRLLRVQIDDATEADACSPC